MSFFLRDFEPPPPPPPAARGVSLLAHAPPPKPGRPRAHTIGSMLGLEPPPRIPLIPERSPPITLSQRMRGCFITRCANG